MTLVILSQSVNGCQKIMINYIGHIKSVGKWVSQKIMINDIIHIKSVSRWVSQKIVIDDIILVTLSQSVDELVRK
jgi:hypothetical protein